MIVAATCATEDPMVRLLRCGTRAALGGVIAVALLHPSPAVAAPPTTFRDHAWGSPPAEGMVRHAEFPTSASYRTKAPAAPLFGVPVELEDYFYSIDGKLFLVRVYLERQDGYTQMLSALIERFGPPSTPPSTWTWPGSRIEIGLHHDAASARSLLFIGNDEFEVKTVGCRDRAALTACVGRWSAAEMTAPDIARFVNEGLPDCFPVDDQNALWRLDACLPLQVGNDVRNGKTIEVVYHCSDTCPGNGRVFLRYRGVDEASCCAVGGSPYAYPGWGGFAGCRPPEMQRPEPVRDANGNMKLGIRAICDPAAGPTIVGDLPTPRPDPVCRIEDVAAEPEEGGAPLTVQFEAEAACLDQPVHYAWDFGDGTRGGDTPRPSHTYQTPGDYIATLVVRSADGSLEPDEYEVDIWVK